METYDMHSLLHTLRLRLAPVEQAEAQVDELEGSLPDARRAAVLVPLFEQDGEVFLAFIRRAATLRAHSGEIAFPGGSVEPGDTSLAMTALREAEEEIGLKPANVEVLGVLPPVATVVSNFLITPVVAFLPSGLGELHLQVSEVHEMLLFPLRGLADPTILYTEQWTRNDITRVVYFYDYASQRIWGATGRILNILLKIVHDPPLL